MPLCTDAALNAHQFPTGARHLLGPLQTQGIPVSLEGRSATHHPGLKYLITNSESLIQITNSEVIVVILIL